MKPSRTSGRSSKEQANNSTLSKRFANGECLLRKNLAKHLVHAYSPLRLRWNTGERSKRENMRMREPPPGLQPGCGPATCVSSRIRYAGHPTSAPCCFRERQVQNVRRAKTTASGLDSIRERPATHSRAKHFSFPPQASQKKSDSSEATDAQRETSRSRRRALALVVRGSGAEEQRHAEHPKAPVPLGARAKVRPSSGNASSITRIGQQLERKRYLVSVNTENHFGQGSDPPRGYSDRD